MRKMIIGLMAAVSLAIFSGGLTTAQARSLTPEFALNKLQRTCQNAAAAGCQVSVAQLTPQAVMELTTCSCRQVRAVAVYTLGEMGQAEAVELLVGLLQDPDRHIRRIAARALGKIGDRRALEPLAALLADEGQDVGVRCTAAWALGCLGDSRVCPLLEQAAASPSCRLGSAGRDAVNHLRGEGENVVGRSL
jgi:HEAT repeat protein